MSLAAPRFAREQVRASPGRGGVNTEQIRRGRANAGASGAVFFSLYFYLHSVHLRVVAWWGRRLVGASHV